MKKETPETHFEQYHFSVATSADNSELIELLHDNPIRMEMEYVVDKQGDFFRMQRFLPGSITLISRNKSTGEIAGCLSLLKFEGRLSDEATPFQYVSGLIKSRHEYAPVMMKKLLNYALRQHFDTNFVFALINAENKRARSFTAADMLLYRGKIFATFHYLEMAPLARQRIPRSYTYRPVESREDLTKSLDFINDYYKNHLLYRLIDQPYWEKMCKELPGFSAQNLWMLFEGDTLKGAMICYNPEPIGGIVAAKMDAKTRFLFKTIRLVNRLTGLLFSPPLEGERIKTLQIRHLAGVPDARNALLRLANNIARRQKLHSVSMLVDQREAPATANLATYRYRSLLYAACKPGFFEQLGLFEERLAFFDVGFG